MRSITPLKHFIDESILKDYKNFRRLKNGLFELHTPRKKKGFDPANEEIFRAYETYKGRTYKNYQNRDKLIAAIKKSKSYQFLSYKLKILLFRERTPYEIANLKKDEPVTLEKMLDGSPASSGYESGGYSSSSSPESFEFSDEVIEDVSQSNEYIKFDEDMAMEEESDPSANDNLIQELCREPYAKFNCSPERSTGLQEGISEQPSVPENKFNVYWIIVPVPQIDSSLN